MIIFALPRSLYSHISIKYWFEDVLNPPSGIVFSFHFWDAKSKTDVDDGALDKCAVGSVYKKQNVSPTKRGSNAQTASLAAQELAEIEETDIAHGSDSTT